MANSELLLFGFSYHRVGSTDRWRPGGSTLGRLTPEKAAANPGARLAQHSDQIVWIDVSAEKSPDQDIDELSRTCEVLAEAEFRKLYPQAELSGLK